MQKLKVYMDDGSCKAPSRATGGSAGYDLCIKHSVRLEPNKPKMCHTGVHVEIPRGYVGLVFVRSSIGTRYHVVLSNGTGVIDSDYRGEVMVPLLNIGSDSVVFASGNRVAQLVVVPALMADVECVDSDGLTETERGVGGFGSTGE